MSEEWRAIPDWDQYDVSSEGRVRRRLRDGSLSVLKPRRLKSSWVVNLRGLGKNTVVRTPPVHRLVALAFLGIPLGNADRTAVWLRSGDDTDCRLANLVLRTEQAPPAKARPERRRQGPRVRKVAPKAPRPQFGRWRGQETKPVVAPKVDPKVDLALAVGLRRWTVDDPPDAPFRAGIRNLLYQRQWERDVDRTARGVA